MSQARRPSTRARRDFIFSNIVVATIIVAVGVPHVRDAIVALLDTNVPQLRVMGG